MKKLSQIGEAGLLRLIRRWCGSKPRWPAGISLRVPLGDDAAVVNLSTPSSLVLTTDTLLEGTHFKIDWINKYGISWLGEKAMAVNLSDLAAMGNVRPILALVTLGLNGDISVDSVDNLYRGLQKASRKEGVSILGGDIIRSDKSIISITVVGKISGGFPVTRSGAQNNDVLMVSGPLGLSSGGLKILKNQADYRGSYTRSLISAHLRPQPKLKEGRILADRATMATAMLDTSDDLMTSLDILSAQSRVGLEVYVDQLPLTRDLLALAKASGVPALSFALYGGEDYQLLFTVPASKAARVLRKIPQARAIGRVLPKKSGIRFTQHGKPFALKDRRFRHF